MSHVIELTDEQYRALTEIAQQRGQTAEAAIAQLIEELGERNREPQRYDTEAWFRHLGATEEQIAEARLIARERGDATA